MPSTYITHQYPNCNIKKKTKDRNIVQSLSPIALFHNLKVIDTGEECNSGLFQVNLSGGVNEAVGDVQNEIPAIDRGIAISFFSL